MSWLDVTMVRVFITEGEGRLNELLELLHDRERVRGVTVYRGISGYGRSGRMHEAHWVELSPDLPICLEFFDTPEKIEVVLADLDHILEPGHVVSWPARANLEAEG